MTNYRFCALAVAVSATFLVGFSLPQKPNSTAYSTASGPEDEIVNEDVVLWNFRNPTFSIDPEIPPAQAFQLRQAASYVSSVTPFSLGEVPWGKGIIEIRKGTGTGCSATVGMIVEDYGSGVDYSGSMSFGSNCDTISAIHEFGHVIGLQHEHQRLNRDDHIKLNESAFLYIQKKYPQWYRGVVLNLRKINTRYYRYVNYKLVPANLDDNLMFDKGSVMMYGSYPRNNIILAGDLINHNLPLYRDNDGNLIQRPGQGFSQKDLDLIRRLYPD